MRGPGGIDKTLPVIARLLNEDSQTAAPFCREAFAVRDQAPSRDA